MNIEEQLIEQLCDANGPDGLTFAYVRGWIERWEQAKNDEQKYDEAMESLTEDARKNMIPKMDQSSLVVMTAMGITPDDFDVRFALQLGAAIILNKPIVSVFEPGQYVPPKLQVVTDEFVEYSSNKEAVKDGLLKATERIVKKIQAEQVDGDSAPE